jgi:alpha-mannosidase
MAADEVKVTSSSTAFGEITTRGRLLTKKGEVCARFVQQYQVSRGSRVLRLDIQIELLRELQADPWNSYCACRFAWANEAASLFRGIHEARQLAEGKRLEAPLYLEVESADERTSILTGGLPYHRRTSPRMLDTLLIVRGETAQRFQLGIAIDAPQPLVDAIGLLAPTTHAFATAAPPAPATSGWLFHLDTRTVVATHVEPLVEESRVVGLRLRRG